MVVLFCIFNPKVMDAWKNMKNPTPDAEQGEEKAVEVELEVPVEVPAEEVTEVSRVPIKLTIRFWKTLSQWPFVFTKFQ